MPKIRSERLLTGVNLTRKQKKYADLVLAGKSQTQAAIEAYDISKPQSSTPRTIGAENMAKPSIIEYIQSMAKGAASRVEELSKKAKNEAVKLNANRDILDRALGKAVEYQRVQMQGEVHIHLD